MSYERFVFEEYSYDEKSGEVRFQYSFDGERRFVETISLEPSEAYDQHAFDAALRLAFILGGISYYKTFPTKHISIDRFELTPAQADFFSEVYRDGLSQFVYENNLAPDVIAVFDSSQAAISSPMPYSGVGSLALQSGGKDSLLLASMLENAGVEFTPWYVSSVSSMPNILHSLKQNTLHRIRHLDTDALHAAEQDGGLNGHVPITYIIMSYALLDAILLGKKTVLAAIGHEGDEPHAYIEEYAIRHQWSKTWHAEQLFANYIAANISEDIHVGSPLRQYSELKISELFVEHAWSKYSRDFSSCNVANYRQGHDNTHLEWCGDCAKCANSYLLFAAFVDPDELEEIFGVNLFESRGLEDDFRGLLGIGDAVKPFECVGETDELRKAYELALARGYEPLPFDVPPSNFDKDARYPAQDWANATIEG